VLLQPHLQTLISSCLTACAYNRQSTLEQHQSQSLLVLLGFMPSQLVVAVVVETTLVTMVVAVLVELRGVGL
jgi:hypothetical protein